MPQIGPLEILVVGVLALLVFGPEKLPEMARSLGKGLTQLKRAASEVKSEFALSLEDEDGVVTGAAPATEAVSTDAHDPRSTLESPGPAARV